MINFLRWLVFIPLGLFLGHAFSSIATNLALAILGHWTFTAGAVLLYVPGWGILFGALGAAKIVPVINRITKIIILMIPVIYSLFCCIAFVGTVIFRVSPETFFNDLNMTEKLSPRWEGALLCLSVVMATGFLFGEALKGSFEEINKGKPKGQKSNLKIFALEREISKAGSLYEKLKAADEAIEIASSEEAWPTGVYPRRIGLGNFLAMKGQVLLELAKDDPVNYRDQALEVLEKASEVLTTEDLYEWAILVSYRAGAILDDPIGTPAEKAEKAISLYRTVKFDVSASPDKTLRYNYFEGLAHCHFALHKREGDKALNEALAAVNEASKVVQALPDKNNHFKLIMLESLCYRRLETGNLEENQERSSTLARAALSRISEKSHPFEWASGHLGLCVSLSGEHHRSGSLKSNYKDAIQSNDIALKYFSQTKSAHLAEYAETYFWRIKLFQNSDVLNRESNLEEVEYAAKEALSYFTKERFPDEYSEIINNLAVAKSKFTTDIAPSGHQEVLRLSIEAAEGVSAEKDPAAWIDSQLNIARNYLSLPIDEATEENLETVIGLYNKCLDLAVRSKLEAEEVKIRAAMSNAYAVRRRGEFWQNLERSIQLDEQCLGSRYYIKRAVSWAGIASNIAESYLHRPKGDKADNLERAMSYIEAALVIIEPEDHPNSYARLKILMGQCFIERLRGEKISNLKEAVFAYRRARKFQTKAEGVNILALVEEKRATFQLEMLGYSLEKLDSESPLESDFDQGFSSVDRMDILRGLREYASQIDLDKLPDAWISIHITLSEWEDEVLPFVIDLPADRLARLGKMNSEQALDKYEKALGVARKKGLRGTLPKILRAKVKILRSLISSSVIIEYPDGEDLARVLSVHNPTLPEYAKGYLEQAIKAQHELIDLTPFEADEFNHLVELVKLGELLTEFKAWEEAIDVFEKVDSLVDHLVLSLRIGKVQSEEILKLFSLCSSYGALAAALNDEPYKAIHFLERGRLRLQAKASGVEQLAIDSTGKAQVQEHIISLNQAERLLASSSSIDRKETLERVEALRLRVEELYGVATLMDQSNPVIGEEAIRESLSNHQCLFFPVFTMIGSLAVIAYEECGDVMLDVIELGPFHSFVGSFWNYREWKEGLSKKTDKDDLDDLFSAFVEELKYAFYVPLEEWIAEEVDSIQKVKIFPDSALALLPLGVKWAKGEKSLANQAISLCLSLGKPSAVVEETDITYKLMSVSNPHNQKKSLTFAEIESTLVESWFGADQRFHLSGKSAKLVPTLEAMSQFNIWHFACHGSFDTKEALNSRLHLSGDDTLTAEKLINSEGLVAPELVVLSACETGVFDTEGAPNEFVGLASSFLHLGASSVVVSLWKVSDIATCLLMGRFYEELFAHNMDASIALDKAQHWLSGATHEAIHQVVADWLNSRRLTDAQRDQIVKALKRTDSENDFPFEDPYYWSGFVCYER